MIVVGDDHIAHVDGNSQGQAAIDIRGLPRGRQRLLDPHRAPDSFDDARERSQQAVARGLEHAPAMLGDRRVDNRQAEPLEAR